MNQYINIYNGEVTENEKNGNIVSTGEGENPVSIDLNASSNDSGCALLAIRTEVGYVGNDAIISFSGETADKWRVAKDNGYNLDNVNESADWQESISFDNISSTNTLFWVRAASTEDESPLNDTSVKINLDVLISEGN